MVQDGGRGLVDPTALAACFAPSPANPGYGLTWWLLRPGLVPPGPRAGIDADAFARLGGLEVRMAAGAGNQRLYLIPDRELVVVRQADGILQALRGVGQLPPSAARVSSPRLSRTCGAWTRPSPA
jgi:hypothetical protein